MTEHHGLGARDRLDGSPSGGDAEAATARLRIDLGRRMLAAQDVAALKPGRVVELDCTSDADVEIYADGRLLARGQAVVVDGRFAVRVREVLSKELTPVGRHAAQGAGRIGME